MNGGLRRNGVHHPVGPGRIKGHGGGKVKRWVGHARILEIQQRRHIAVVRNQNVAEPCVSMTQHLLVSGENPLGIAHARCEPDPLSRREPSSQERLRLTHDPTEVRNGIEIQDASGRRFGVIQSVEDPERATEPGGGSISLAILGRHDPARQPRLDDRPER